MLLLLLLSSVLLALALLVFDRELDLVWREVSVLWVPLVQTTSTTSTAPIDCSLSLLWLIRLCLFLFLLSNRLACDLYRAPPFFFLTGAVACGGIAVSLAIVIVSFMVDTENSIVVLVVS